MTDLCSCGTELRVTRGGFVRCEHCDGPDCCRSNAAHCRACARYARNLERRYPERSGS